MVKPVDQPGSRERIVAAAGELIVEAGWGNVTTRSIAERAGVNNALIHYYFGSKDTLLLEAAAAAFAEESEGPFALLTGAETVGDALKSVFSWLASVDAHSPMMIISMEAAHQAIRDGRVAEFLAGVWSRYFEAFAQVIAEGQEKGEIREDVDAMGAATAFGALLDGLFLYRLVSTGVDIGKASAVVETLIDSLAKGRQ
jgi:AcrR family transcriptional regulator